MLLRKLTCRTIAQWAVNCVDARDPDVIMTPFEYDENPWDGWGEWDDNWNADPATWPTNLTDPASPTFLPLDGDPATNENDAWVIDWSLHTPANPGRPKTLVQLLVTPGSAISTTNPPIITVPFNQTRGIVWGAERPELLITETLALHDRRTDDRKGDAPDKHGELHGATDDYYADTDMDQHCGRRARCSSSCTTPGRPTDNIRPSFIRDSIRRRTINESQQRVWIFRGLSNLGVNELYNTTGITVPTDARLTSAPSGLDASNRMTKRCRSGG